MNESDFCPECGNNLALLNDTETGEIVCTTCGLVIGNTQYTPPAEHIPTKTTPVHPIVYTSLSVGREIDSYQQLEIAIAKDTKWIVQQLALPNNTTQTAINYTRKLRHATRRHNPYKIRFTRTELTALSIWNALKQLNHPISYDEFTKQITSLIGNINLMKTQNRANYFLNIHNRIPNTNFVIAHINKTLQTNTL
jgi:transcription initiation factor TFIIIB Brf1 subunit/transcription initiation factor TFIIB